MGEYIDSQVAATEAHVRESIAAGEREYEDLEGAIVAHGLARRLTLERERDFLHEEHQALDAALRRREQTSS